MFGWFKRRAERRAANAAMAEARQAILRQIAARYDAAQTTNENKNHWLAADSLSPIAANSLAVRQKLRNRSRYEVSNNCYANGMVRTLAYHCVGSGPTLSIDGETDADREIEDKFAAWANAINLADKIRIMRETRARDGEAFGMLTTNPLIRNDVKLDLVLVEADRWTDPAGTFDTSRYVDGIEFDAAGNPISYQLLDNHPGELANFGTSGTIQSRQIPASNVLHWFRTDRPGQVRGIPEITAALPLYAILRRYTLAVLGTAEIAAMWSLFLKTTSPAIDPASVDPYDVIDVERNGMMTMPEGWDVSQLKAEQPTTTYDAFTRTVLREIARCLDMPFNIAAGDSSSYNYSSGKLDHQTYFRAIDVDRHSCERTVLNRIFDEWFDDALLTDGALVVPRTNLTRPFVEWDWPPFEHVDPLKESNATTNDLASGLTSIPTELARRGRKWEREWARQARALGLTMTEFQRRMAEKLFNPNGAPQLAQPGDSETQNQPSGAAA